MATYEEELRRKQLMYPSMYPAGSEDEVLHHLFFVLGNGYEWRNGELVDIYDDYTDTYLLANISENEVLEQESEAKAEQVINEMFSELGEERPPKLTGEALRQRKIEFDEFIVGIGGTPYLDYDNPPEHLVNAKKVSRKLYPICEFTKCFTMPSNVKPDWLAAARRALNVARNMIRTEEDDIYLDIFEQRIDVLEYANKTRNLS